MKKLIVVVSVLICAGFTIADESERNVTTSPLSIYSSGLGIGSIVPINEELKDESEGFLSVTWTNSIYLQDHISLFIDASWFAPKVNFGINAGFDFFMTKSGFRPFVGLGAGLQYYDKSKNEGENIGPAGTVHAGFLLDVTDRFQVRFRVPYYVVANDNRDHAAGFELGFLFSGRFKNIKKINYN